VIPGATLLFVLGVAFTYYLFLPRALPFLLGFGGFVTDPRPSNYIKFIIGIMFWIGIAFEFPLLIVLLAKLGWIEARTLAKQWRIAIVIIAVVAAMVTPTVDPYSMGMVMLPMIVLYGISVLLAFLVQTKSPAPN
jgi:sec-independent protein translocase protein TatC